MSLLVRLFGRYVFMIHIYSKWWINDPYGWRKKTIESIWALFRFPRCCHLRIWEQRIVAARSVLRAPRKAVFLSVEVVDKKKMMYFTAATYNQTYQHLFLASLWNHTMMRMTCFLILWSLFTSSIVLSREASWSLEWERGGILFHALSALEGPAARKVPSLISHGHLEGCRVAEEVVPSSSGLV